MGPVEAKSVGFNAIGILTLQSGLLHEWDAVIGKNLRRHSNNVALDAYY